MLLVLTLAFAGAVVGTAVATAPRVVSYTPSHATRNDRPTVVLYLQNVEGLRESQVAATVNGVDVSKYASVRVQGDRGEIALRLPPLSEGRHDVRISTEPFGMLRRQLKAAWTFSVDTAAPGIRLASPRGARPTSDVRNTRFSIETEPDARVVVASTAHTATKRADEDGKVSLLLATREGSQRVTITSRDRAGNSTRRSLELFVDSLAPVTRFTVPKVSRSNEVRIAANASDANGVEVTASIDGERARILRAGRVSFVVVREEPLSEGVHTLVFEATDRFGHRTTTTRRTRVDSTEELGEVTLGMGARGRDVRQLQQRLRELEFWRAGKAARREWRRKEYGKATAAAVTRFQTDKSLSADGVAGVDTIAAMTLHIVIDRGAHTLTLYRVDKVVRQYMIAVGQSAYPTPSGEFHIVNMQEDPTWVPPPDSDWAKGAKPIPPGPNNPLGTRWMGLDARNVGIHGTNNPASVGYSVSHGCIRMQIPDVEDLFSLVRVGTPVTIV